MNRWVVVEGATGQREDRKSRKGVPRGVGGWGGGGKEENQGGSGRDCGGKQRDTGAAEREGLGKEGGEEEEGHEAWRR